MRNTNRANRTKRERRSGRPIAQSSVPRPALQGICQTSGFEPRPSRTSSTANCFLSLVWQGVGAIALAVLLAPMAAGRAETQIDVGIVQRFGEETDDTLAISSPDGDRLQLRFREGGELQTVEVEQVTLSVENEPLADPQLQEYIVLGDRATFESAEELAKQWQARGVAAEVTQPGRWQVWAEREVYRTPLLRRWLLESLRANGYDRPRLETAIATETPLVTWEIGERRYAKQHLEIDTESDLVLVNDGEATRTYGGDLVVQPNAYGNYTLVNKVDIETYLRGVVPYEIAPEAPPTAIEAQAIIARTYALRNVRRFAADNYQLCATTHCQVYRGLSAATQRTDRAIAATAGQVLTYEGELVDALYSSTTGGVTAEFDDIWDGEKRPYLQAIVDAPQASWDLTADSLDSEETFRRFIASQRSGYNETGTPAFRWSRRSSIEDLADDLRRYLERIQHPNAEFEVILSMEVVERSRSGRILQLDVATDTGEISLHKTEVRSAFGPPISTLFYLEPIRSGDRLQGFAFVGGGFGHGVGLSQYGSYNLSRLGWSAREILAFYYPGAAIVPLDTGG